MRSFDFYEFAGVLTPGAIVLTGLLLLYPSLRASLFTDSITVGDLGLFVLLAYAAGHLVQAVGNGVEWVWWEWFRQGRPTDWVRTGRHHLLAPEQLALLDQKITIHLRLPTIHRHKESARAWFGITRQIYAAIAAEARASRVDIFNGNYGLTRGLAAAFLVLEALTVGQQQAPWQIDLALFLGMGIALTRMDRFGRHYARELFAQFLQLPDPAQTQEALDSGQSNGNKRLRNIGRLLRG